MIGRIKIPALPARSCAQPCVQNWIIVHVLAKELLGRAYFPFCNLEFCTQMPLCNEVVFIFPHFPFRDSFEENKREPGRGHSKHIIHQGSMSKRAIEREQGTIETGGKKGRQVLRRQNVREFVTLCV